jgi:hypothetical protein
MNKFSSIHVYGGKLNNKIKSDNYEKNISGWLLEINHLHGRKWSASYIIRVYMLDKCSWNTLY